MCYNKEMNRRKDRKSHQNRTSHHMIACDQHKIGKWGHIFKFPLCQLFEIPSDNDKGFELLCFWHNDKREIELDRLLDIKLGILSTPHPESEQLKDLSMDSNPTGV